MSLHFRPRTILLVLLVLVVGGAAGWSLRPAGPANPVRSGVIWVGPPAWDMLELNAMVISAGAGAATARQPTAAAVALPPAQELDAVWQRETRNHAELMGSLHNYKRLLANYASPLHLTHWYRDRANDADALLWLNRHVKVKALPNTSLIEIRVDGKCSDYDAGLIVRTVGDVYISEFVDARVLERTAAIRTQLDALLISCRADLSAEEAKLSALLNRPAEDREPEYEHKQERLAATIKGLRDELANIEAAKRRLSMIAETQRSQLQWRAQPMTGELPPPDRKK